MEAVAKRNSVYLETFEASGARLREPSWLLERRKAAMDRFEAMGLPSRRMEAWRNNDFSAIVSRQSGLVAGGGESDAIDSPLSDVPLDACRLVFVDGDFCANRSTLGDLPRGISIRSLAESLESDDATLREHWGRHLAAPDAQPFVALNTALCRDGAVIRVAAGVAAERPIAVLFESSAAADRRLVVPRLLLVVEESAEIELIEVHHGVDGADYLSCPVTEIAVGENARVTHYRLLLEGAAAGHAGAVHASVSASGRFGAHSLALGGKLARTDLFANLDAPGAEVDLSGLYLAEDGQYLDHHTWVNHPREHGVSRQLFKGILKGKSETVFDGLVKVAEGAQKTDAQQQNRNLLLSRRATAHSNPRLEIYADDVKCSHGSTIGELDKDAVFYLQSRGIGAEEAQGLLTMAFVAEALDCVRIEALKDYERRLLFDRLPGGQSMLEGL